MSSFPVCLICSGVAENVCMCSNTPFFLCDIHVAEHIKLQGEHYTGTAVEPLSSKEVSRLEKVLKKYKHLYVHEALLGRNSIIDGLLRQIKEVEEECSSLIESILNGPITRDIEEIIHRGSLPLFSQKSFVESLLNFKRRRSLSKNKIRESLGSILPSPKTLLKKHFSKPSSSSQTLPPITVSVQTASEPSLSLQNLPPLSLTPVFITDETRWELLKQKNKAHDKQINSIAISDSEQFIASASADKTIKIWNLITLELIRTLKGHKQTVRSVSFLGDRVVSGSEDNTIKIWENEKCVKTLNIHSDDVNCVCVSNCKTFIVSGSFDKTVKVYSLQQDKTVHTLRGHSNTIVSVALSSNDRKIASGSWDMTIKVWNTDNGQLLMTLSRHTAIVSCVCWYGEFIVSCSGDRTIKMWNRRTGQDILTLCGHGGEVMSVDTKDNLIVSLGVDDQILAWNASTNRTLQNLKGHGKYKEDYAMSIKCLDKGNFIVSGGKDRDLKVWKKMN